MVESQNVFAEFDPTRVPTPCYVIDLTTLEGNLQLLRRIAVGADAKVLLALKAFACFEVADLIGTYLDGTAASGLWEARLGHDRFSGEVHAYVLGLKSSHLEEIQTYADYLIFNSLTQWQRFAPLLHANPSCAYGLRLNPQHSEVEIPAYDPCAAWSRLGALAEDLTAEGLEQVRGFHVHALCDQGYAPFDRLLAATESRFGHFFGHVDWINLGGGQLLTAPDYPVECLIARLCSFRQRSGLEIYLEPGTAVVLNAGALVAEVLDTGWNDGNFAILDTSATCHMPDVIEAPYTPDLLDGISVNSSTELPAQDDSIFRLGGSTCMAGDVIGTYRFKDPPKTGDRLIFLDQAYYTMVKSTTFNGTQLPSIALWDSRSDELRVIREFGYEAFESRLA